MSKYTIFYADDDLDDLDFFREIIENLDADVELVTQQNGQQVLYAINNPPPHPSLLFLDINMPGMTGLEVLKTVRESGNRDLPIVMFSTSSDELTIKKSRELGANFYVPKSGIFEHLKKSIEHALNINWSSFIPNEKNFVYSY